MSNGISQTAQKVTIFIPTYNRCQLLPKALESALAQTYPWIEVLVLNNGSTDSTKAVLAQYSDERITILENEHNIYPPDGYRTLAASSGHYWMCLSDDDWLEPTFLEEVVGLWMKKPELVFVHARCSVESKHGSSLGPGFPDIMEGIELVRSFFEQRGGPSLCATLFRSEDVRRNLGLIQGDYLGDAPLWTSLAFEGRVGFVDRPLAHYQLSDSSAIVQTLRPVMSDYLKLASRCQDAFRQRGLSSKTIKVLKKACNRGAGAVFASLLFRKATIGATTASLLAELRASWPIVKRMHWRSYIIVAKAIMTSNWVLRIILRIGRLIRRARLII